jgi:hypothetical protein
MGNLNKCAFLSECALSAQVLENRWWERGPYSQYVITTKNTVYEFSPLQHVYYKVAPIHNLAATGFDIAARISRYVCPFLDPVLWTGVCKGRRLLPLLLDLQPQEKYVVQVMDCTNLSPVAPYHTMSSFTLTFQLAVVFYTLECYQIMLNSLEVGIRHGLGYSDNTYLLVNDKLYNLGSDRSFKRLTIVDFSTASQSSAEHPFVTNLDWLWNVRETFLRLNDEDKEALLDVLLPKHMQLPFLVEGFENGNPQAIRMLCNVVNPLPECISKLAALGNIEEHNVNTFLKDNDLDDVFVLDRRFFDEQGNFQVPDYTDVTSQFQKEQNELGELQQSVIHLANKLWGKNEVDEEDKSCWFENKPAYKVLEDLNRHVQRLTILYEDPVAKREAYNRKIASERFLVNELERLLVNEDTPLTVPPTLEHLVFSNVVSWTPKEQVAAFLKTYNALYIADDSTQSLPPVTLVQQSLPPVTLVQQSLPPVTLVQQLLLQNRVTPQPRPTYIDGPNEVQVLTLGDGKLVYLFGEKHKGPVDVLSNGSGVDHAGNRMMFNQYITLLSQTSRAFVDLYLEISSCRGPTTSYVDTIHALSQSSSIAEFELNFQAITASSAAELKPSKTSIFTEHPSTVLAKFIDQFKHPEVFGLLCKLHPVDVRMTSTIVDNTMNNWFQMDAIYSQTEFLSLDVNEQYRILTLLNLPEFCDMFLSPGNPGLAFWEQGLHDLPMLKTALKHSSCPDKIQQFIVDELNQYITDNLEPMRDVQNMLQGQTPLEPLHFFLFLTPFFALFLDMYTLSVMFRLHRRASEQQKDMPLHPSTLMYYAGAAHTRKAFKFMVQHLQGDVLYDFQSEKLFVELPVQYQL